MQSTITFQKDISKYQKNHNVPEKNRFKIKIREKTQQRAYQIEIFNAK